MTTPALAARPAAPRPKTCSGCGATFACGPGTGSAPGACWCQDLPPLMPIEPGIDCYCPTCLAAATSRPVAAAPPAA